MNVEMKILSNEMLHLGYILCIKVEDMRLFDENNLEVNRYCEQATAQNLYVPRLINLSFSRHSFIHSVFSVITRSAWLSKALE